LRRLQGFLSRSFSLSLIPPVEYLSLPSFLLCLILLFNVLRILRRSLKNNKGKGEEKNEVVVYIGMPETEQRTISLTPLLLVCLKT
jgi:hypothetical protein